MSGPMGGNPGAARTVGKGQRRLKTKGIRLGSYVHIYYRIPGKPGHAEDEIEYEGKLVDKRVGGHDRESYVELENCMELDSQDRLVEMSKRKTLSDAFIEHCKVVEKREVPPEPAPKPEPEPDAMAGGMLAMHGGMMPAMMPSMMPGMMSSSMPTEMSTMMQSTPPGGMPDANPASLQNGIPGAMSGGMPGMMPGTIQGGLMQMGGMQQGMQMMPGMMPNMMPTMMPGMMMPMGMGVMPMGMGTPMGMMPMGMMNMCANAAQNTEMPILEADANTDGGVHSGTGMVSIDAKASQSFDRKKSGSAMAKPSRHHAEASENLADVDLGSKILVKYQHPTLGKIKYEGVLVEKQIDGTSHDSFIELQDCKQLSASGKIKNREDSKKLMSAFINLVRFVKESPAESQAISNAAEGSVIAKSTGRSRSREKQPR